MVEGGAHNPFYSNVFVARSYQMAKPGKYVSRDNSLGKTAVLAVDGRALQS